MAFSLLNFFVHFLLFLFGSNKYIKIQNILCKLGLVPNAWSLYGGADNLNIAFPDNAAMYVGSFVCLGNGETISLESDIPYARYYSIQVYDSTTASLGSLNDHEIDTVGGKFTVNITKVESVRNITKIAGTNNLLKVSTPDDFLIIMFRVYDVINSTSLVKQHNALPDGKKETFGWITPPNLYKYDKTNKLKLVIPHSDSCARIAFPRIYANRPPFKESKYNNTKNNFFKPYSAGYFSNDDASYLVSTISLHNSTNTKTKTVGAIIKGFLPSTARNSPHHFKQYRINNVCHLNDSYLTNQTNFENHPDYYEVRYVSFNMGTLSMPFPTIAGPMLKTYHGFKVNPKDISSTGKPGITDTDIINTYNNTNEWHNAGRPFTIYVGLNLDHIKRLGGNPDTDLYMIYPTHYDTGLPFTYPVIIFRHLMSQERFMQNPIFKHGIGQINKQFATPNECKHFMGKYYPEIDFFYV